MKEGLPEADYVQQLMAELDQQLAYVQGRPLTSIFFGGGTPSLFSGRAIGEILAGVAKRIHLPADTEITLEANPGTIDYVRFCDFYAAGINRLSLGIQSLQDEKLKALGRIHDRANALAAINAAKRAGFENMNLDIMYGLPNQTLAEALDDIKTALACSPTHFSWYQLTIEPNTLFYHQTPSHLPVDDALWDMQLAGQALIEQAGFSQYEVSAYATPNRRCQHNVNYWEFGDYLGIGAGAHSKITLLDQQTALRFSQIKHPRDYLQADFKTLGASLRTIEKDDLIFEFMLNALRLTKGVSTVLFTGHTGLPLAEIEPLLNQAKQRGLLLDSNERLCASDLGKKFLNDLISIFLVVT